MTLRHFAWLPELFLLINQSSLSSKLPSRSAVISMGNIMICSEFLNTEVSHLSQIISSLEIMLTEENKAWRPSASSLLTRSSTQKTSSSSEETTNAHLSTDSMDSMMNAREDIVLSFGRYSLMFSIVSQSLLLLTIKFSACTAVSAPN